MQETIGKIRNALTTNWPFSYTFDGILWPFPPRGGIALLPAGDERRCVHGGPVMNTADVERKRIQDDKLRAKFAEMWERAVKRYRAESARKNEDTQLGKVSPADEHESCAA